MTNTTRILEDDVAALLEVYAADDFRFETIEEAKESLFESLIGAMTCLFDGGPVTAHSSAWEAAASAINEAQQLGTDEAQMTAEEAILDAAAAMAIAQWPHLS